MTFLLFIAQLIDGKCGELSWELFYIPIANYRKKSAWINQVADF